MKDTTRARRREEKRREPIYAAMVNFASARYHALTCSLEGEAFLESLGVEADAWTRMDLAIEAYGRALCRSAETERRTRA